MKSEYFHADLSPRMSNYNLFLVMWADEPMKIKYEKMSYNCQEIFRIGSPNPTSYDVVNSKWTEIPLMPDVIARNVFLLILSIKLSTPILTQ